MTEIKTVKDSKEEEVEKRTKLNKEKDREILKEIYKYCSFLD